MTHIKSLYLPIVRSGKPLMVRRSLFSALLCGFVAMSGATRCFAHHNLPDPSLDLSNSIAEASDLCLDLSLGNTLEAASDAYSGTGSLAATTNPGDPDYETIAVPVIPVVAPITPTDKLNAQTAIDEAALAQNKLAVGGYLLAAATSANRSHSGFSSGEGVWEVKQYQYALLYLSEAGKLQSKQIALRLNLYNDLIASGTSTTVTAAEITALQQQIAADGLPASLTKQLTDYGLTSAQIAGFTKQVASVVPDKTAGTYPETLISTGILANLAITAAEFSGSPILVNPATQGVIQLGSSAPINVIIPGSQTLDVSTLNTAVMHLGLNVARPLTSKISDYNGDGIPDLVLTFSTSDTGIQAGDAVIGFYCSSIDTDTIVNGSAPIIVEAATS